MPELRAQVAQMNKYLTTLESAWQEHLAERQLNAPTVVSLFAGCGGSSLGYSMAGFRELLACDWDDNAVKTFSINFPDVPVVHGDIADLSVDRVLDITGLRPGELDVLDGSPPCQGFSTAGKRIIDDPRNQLFVEYVRLLRGLRPKVFVMENVSGLVKGKMKLVFTDVLRELKASGYKVSARLLNAMYFGVPQSRQRVIFIGIRDDLGVEPSHPAAESRPVSVREAFDGADVSLALEANEKYVEPMSNLKPGENLSKLTKESFYSYGKVPIYRPSQTIMKQVTFGKVSLWHYGERRNISIGEAKRLGSFPDEFEFIGSYEEQWARIGNSVPPLFMRAIAKHIRTNILDNLPN